MTTLAIDASRSGPLGRLLADEPVFTRLGLAVALALVPLLAAYHLDPRLVEGSPAWLKPVKFHIALAVYLLTLAVFARWLPVGFTEGRAYRLYAACVSVAIIGELVWIGGASALGTISHFNVSSPVWEAIYGLMGVFAVGLTSVSLVYGIAILRNRASGLASALRLGIGWSLVLTFVLTVIVAGYLAGNDGHFVGVPADPSNGLWLLGWSRETGDLRVAHFLATHAMHLVPLAALGASAFLGARAAVAATLAATGLYAALVLFTFAQALQGLPFLPWLG
jgi:hypothetical protein